MEDLEMENQTTTEARENVINLDRNNNTQLTNASNTNGGSFLTNTVGSSPPIDLQEIGNVPHSNSDEDTDDTDTVRFSNGNVMNFEGQPTMDRGDNYPVLENQWSETHQAILVGVINMAALYTGTTSFSNSNSIIKNLKIVAFSTCVEQCGFRLCSLLTFSFHKRFS